MTSKFFEGRGDQSEVKARIVQKYFDAWSRIVVGTAIQHGNGKIAYIDLYAGPGRYKDGAASTPLLVLEKAISDDRVRNALVALFNDADRDNSNTLQREIAKLPGIETLKHKPEVYCGEVGDDAAKFFGETKLIPSFTFFDPFGYKGLSLKLINAVVKDWGCDCVFFFNYNRINAGVLNPAVENHMKALFGEASFSVLRKQLEGKKPEERVEIVLEALSQAILAMGAKFVLPFRFRNPGGRLTHCLIFVSKHFKGYKVMKDIMAKESSSADQSVPSFEYSPANESMPFLFEFTRPLDELPDMLLNYFSGGRLSFDSIHEEHSVGKPFLESHYKSVLSELEEKGLVEVFDPESKRRVKGKFPNRLIVRFPGRPATNDDVIED